MAGGLWGLLAALRTRAGQAVALVLAGAAWAIYARVDDAKQGVK